MVLHPPELGAIDIRVTVRNGNVQVLMIAQEAAARLIAEDQSGRLADALSTRDLRMESFEVRRADAANLGEGDRHTSRESGAEDEQRARAERDLESGGDRDPGRAAAQVASAAGGESPLVLPQIISAVSETGVDLRI